MGYQQLITPNPNVACIPGYCLKYVQDTFGIGAKYPTAIAAWNASTQKHQDANWPALWFPIWFTVQGNPAGHVALHAPDHSVYSSSSPTAHLPVHHSSLADMETYWGGTLSYFGWTDDVEDILVIEGENDMLKPSDVNLAFATSPYNRQATQSEIEQWTGKSVSDLLQTIYNNSRDLMTQLENGGNSTDTQKIQQIKAIIDG